jgi:hypothetical protein
MYILALDEYIPPFLFTPEFRYIPTLSSRISCSPLYTNQVMSFARVTDSSDDLKVQKVWILIVYGGLEIDTHLAYRAFEDDIPVHVTQYSRKLLSDVHERLYHYKVCIYVCSLSQWNTQNRKSWLVSIPRT